jgi:Lon protease-like protein
MTIGLFPLQLVLLPGEVLPLHIFEARYKRLIGDCRDGDDTFGIVLRDDEVVAECGCTAAVSAVLEELEDGELNILVEGRRRFRLDEVLQPDDPEGDYVRAVVRFYDDDEGTAPDSGMLETAAGLFRDMVALIGADAPAMAAGATPLSFRLAAAVDFGLPLKQRLLESRSEVERLELLTAVMRSLIPSLELRKEREEAIRGNGKGV